MKDVPSQGSTVERFLVLDGMRGVAALAVLFLHIYQITGNVWKPGLGFLAVDLFFLLSGFVLAHAYEPDS